MAVLSIIISVIAAIILFGLIIFVHELGHFIAAKKSGVKVNEFAIGMGPAVLKFGKKETKYTLRAFPIGGFCSMEGEDEASGDERAFNNKPVWKRIIIITAGAIMNLILGFVLICVFLAVPYQSNEPSYIGLPVIAKIDEKAVSHDGGKGLCEGDRIVYFNGTHIFSSFDLTMGMVFAKGGSADITVKRDGKKVELKAVPFNTEDIDGQKVLRQDFIIKGEKITLLNIIPNAARMMASMAQTVWISLWKLITLQIGFNQLSGPIGTVGAVSQAAAKSVQSFEGFKVMVMLMGFLTINVGVFNLVPFPALDGGRLFFMLIELIRRKKINPKYEGYVHAAGFALLILLMIAVSFGDVIRLIKG